MKKKRLRSRSGSRVSCPFCGEEEEVYVDPGGSERQPRRPPAKPIAQTGNTLKASK